MVGPHLLAGALDGVRLHRLLTGIQTGAPAVAADGLLVATALAYRFGARRLRRRGRRWPARHAAAFGAGMACIWIAVGSGLASYDETSAPLHMVQHILLMMAAPPLLALGRPVLLLTQAAGRRWQVRTARLMRGRLATTVTHPGFATPVYFTAMWLMLVDRRVYDYLVAHQPAHELSHLVLVVVGLLYWPPLVEPSAARHRLSHPARVVLLLLSMPLEALPGVWIRFQSTPIDPLNTLAGTRTAGELFLVAATGACSVWLVAVVVQWFAYALREDRREAARTPAGDDWSRPWWVPSPEPAGPASGVELSEA